MASLRTDSPVSRRIVSAFLDFLNSVEPTPNSDREGIEVIRDCLQDVFKLSSSSTHDQSEPGLLVKYFSSLDSNKEHESYGNAARSLNAPSASSAPDANGYAHIPKPQDLDFSEEPHAPGVPKDELFGQFFAGLDKIHFFSTTEGDDDSQQLDRATRLFHEAVKELERSGCETVNSLNVAETFKSQGNQAMQSKLYSDAVELYTYAIALCQSNAVFYCNRAAAFTQIQKYMEAIKDCKKSIQLDPNYSKAYSRLGLVYYAQGLYFEAIDKGFSKALLLDPNNESIRENIRVAEQKMREQFRPQHQNRANGPGRGGPGNLNVPPQFLNMPLNAATFPSDMASMFMNMMGQHPQGMNDNEPGINIDENFSLNIAGEDLADDPMGTWSSVMGTFSGPNPPPNQQADDPMGTWSSVMGTFSGPHPPQNQQRDSHGGPTPN